MTLEKGAIRCGWIIAKHEVGRRTGNFMEREVVGGTLPLDHRYVPAWSIKFSTLQLYQSMGNKPSNMEVQHPRIIRK